MLSSQSSSEPYHEKEKESIRRNSAAKSGVWWTALTMMSESNSSFAPGSRM